MSDRTPEQVEADLDAATFARLDTAMRDAYGTNSEDGQERLAKQLLDCWADLVGRNAFGLVLASTKKEERTWHEFAEYLGAQTGAETTGDELRALVERAGL